MPKRIQMSRQHPWRAENPDAVIVARPTRWGNPNRVHGAKPFAVLSHTQADIDTQWGIDRGSFLSKNEAVAFAVRCYRWQIENHPNVMGFTVADIQAELAGLDLACWCPLVDGDGNPVPCHVDVLLELANGVVPVSEGDNQ